MHQRLKDIPELAELEQQGTTKLHDVRHFDQSLEVGNGIPRKGKRILTVGTDCSVGKMFTALALEKALRNINVSAQFKATGQTGILIDGRGISIDAVVADFISGAVEKSALNLPITNGISSKARAHCSILLLQA